MLTKVNYYIDPRTLSKDLAEDGKALGAWRDYQNGIRIPNCNLSNPYFVVFQPGQFMLDFDVITKAKIEKEEQKVQVAHQAKKTYSSIYTDLPSTIKNKIVTEAPFPLVWDTVKGILDHYHLPIDPDHTYIIETGTKGLHYICEFAEVTANLKNQTHISHITQENVSVDCRGPGGLEYGPGTQWKDRPSRYTIFQGSEATIPVIPAWKLGWITGILKGWVKNVDLCEFLSGSMDLHTTLGIDSHNEFVIWRESMFMLKNFGYTQEDVLSAFRIIPGFDENKATQQIKAYWEKESDPKRVHYGLTPYQHLPGNTKKDSPGDLNTDWSYSILGESDNDQLEINPKGIYRVKTKYTEGKPINTHKQPLWLWDEFSIHEILVHHENDLVENRYSGRYNGVEFTDKPLDLIRDWMASQSLIVGNRKTLWGPLVREYTEGQQIPKFETSLVVGFTKDGWKLPDQAHIIMNTGIQSRIRDHLKTMMMLVIDPPKVKQSFVDLYQATTLQNKDIIFAYALVAPFLYALRPYTRLMPVLALGSVEGGTGKTMMAVALTTRIWSNLEQEALNKDNLTSVSRAFEYFSSSTFPIPLDDVGDMKDDIKPDLKAYLTQDNFWERKKKDQSLAISKPLCSPLILTFNSLPSLFDDLPMLERTIYIPVTQKPTNAQNEHFITVFHSIPRGTIGKYIYSITSDWTLATLQEFYDSQPDLSGSTDSRMNISYRLLKLGAYFAKQWFNLDLDLQELPRILTETRLLGNDDLLALIQIQIEIGNKIDTDLTFVNKQYPWIHAPIISHPYNGKEGILYGVGNLQELKRYLNQSKISLPLLTNLLQNKWGKDIVYGTITHKNTDAKRIFIPNSAYMNELEVTRVESEKKQIDLEKALIPVIDQQILDISKNNPDLPFDQEDIYTPLASTEGITNQLVTSRLYQLKDRNLIQLGPQTGFLVRDITEFKRYLKGDKPNESNESKNYISR